MSHSAVSVVVPCYNEAGHIAACLDSLLQTAYPGGVLEILVVDGMSTDGTRGIVQGYAGNHPVIRIIDNPCRITPVALNLGVLQAKGDLIMIAGAHTTYPADYIPILVNAMESYNVDIAGGRMLTTTFNPAPKACSIAKALSSRMGVGNSMFRIGVSKPQPVDTVPFGIYKREVFERVGLYDERLVRNHDIELSKRILRAGYSILLVPQATCLYFVRESYGRIAHNNYRNGYWNILTLYITGHYSSLSLRHYVPLLFLLSLLVPVVAGMALHPFSALVAVFSFCLYAALVLFHSTQLNDETTRIRYLVITFLVLHFSYGAGSFAGLFNIRYLFGKR